MAGRSWPSPSRSRPRWPGRAGPPPDERDAPDGARPARGRRRAARAAAGAPLAALVGVLALAGVARSSRGAQYDDARDARADGPAAKVVLDEHRPRRLLRQALGTLGSIAAAPVVVDGLDRQGMLAVLPPRPAPERRSRSPAASAGSTAAGSCSVSSAPRSPRPGPGRLGPLLLRAGHADTGKPFVSEGLVARSRPAPAHRDDGRARPATPSGRRTGVLVGAIPLDRLPAGPERHRTSASQGVNVLDRSGQSLFERFAQPRNARAPAVGSAERARAMLTDTRGLDGECGPRRGLRQRRRRPAGRSPSTARASSVFAERAAGAGCSSWR